MYSTAALFKKRRFFKPYVVYGLSTEEMKNRLFLSLFEPTVIVPPFSLLLQSVIYTFGHFCGESWENESRENFSPKHLEVAFANKINKGASGHIKRKNKSHMVMILQGRGNFTAAFLWALSGDPLVPEACR